MSKRYGTKEYYHLYKNDDIFYLISYGLTEYKDIYTWIPEGIKKQGSSQKVWLKSDLNKFLLK